MKVQIEIGWAEVLKEEFDKEYFIKIVDFLKLEKSRGKVIFPPGSLIFNAFDLSPWDKTRVVILGQDPYHGIGEAMGLCFSVPKSIKIPPSLKNIYKEIQSDLGFPIPEHGDLSPWARQGVLMLNASLTVEKDQANSHKNIGWHQFTDQVIQKLSSQKSYLVFLLWGNYARSKKILIDETKHLILESPHPSPLAGGGFFGQKHFSKTNQYLKEHGKIPVNWKI
ncbi:MAG: uracil-DNA glycosylase [Saprospiraceae bacterium]|nr:uracil-DNA glycosylase [Saprospiraceae bacterium]MCC6844176.1 uracil-DNA glycosylase [Saprospiraceae bacterium]HRG34018.1 uracil-DNA glycosylase [Saprospiraceae bacterium]